MTMQGSRGDAFKALGQELELALLRGFEGMLKDGCRVGHWGSVRGTADCKTAIDYCLPSGVFANLRNSAGDWIAQRIDLTTPGLGNWEQEVWDTAVALIALSFDKARYDEQIRPGVSWLKSLFNREHSNWNDEPWETCWALISIYEALKPNIDADTLDVCRRALSWLTTLMGIPKKGMLVNWHYTSLFILVANRYTHDEVFSPEEMPIAAHLRQLVRESTHSLLRPLKSTGDALWTNELWSNSLVLWALGESDAIESTTQGLERVVAWFDNALLPDKKVLTEDRAFACTGLYRLLLSLESQHYLRLPTSVEGAIKTFPDQTSQDILNACLDIASREASTDIRSRLARSISTELTNTCNDFVARPPLFDCHTLNGYYRIHLRKRTLNVSGIVLATIALAVLTQLSTRNVTSVWSWVITGSLLAIGAFTTVGALFGLSFRDVLRQKDGN